MVDPGLKNGVVLVTGGNNPLGIGAATAKAFAAQGARVFIHFFRQVIPDFIKLPRDAPVQAPSLEMYYALQRRSGEDVAEAIRAAGGQAEAWEADLADPSAAIELLDRAEKTFGPVEVLVNNAAADEFDSFLPEKAWTKGDQTTATGFPVSTLTAASHDRAFAVNSRAPALLMAEFARRHAAAGKTWGRIINVSTDGAFGFASEVSYGASKHALESYSRAAAAELGPYGITVNIVSLGPVQTGYISRELEERLLPAIPLGRVGRPEDVADAILFFASEQARWITGQLLYVGGGNRMHQ